VKIGQYARVRCTRHPHEFGTPGDLLAEACQRPKSGGHHARSHVSGDFRSERKKHETLPQQVLHVKMPDTRDGGKESYLGVSHELCLESTGVIGGRKVACCELKWDFSSGSIYCATE